MTPSERQEGNGFAAAALSGLYPAMCSTANHDRGARTTARMKPPPMTATRRTKWTPQLWLPSQLSDLSAGDRVRLRILLARYVPLPGAFRIDVPRRGTA